MSGGSRSAAGPVDEKRLVGVVRPVVTAAGMDLETVRVSVAGKRRLLRVIVDSDAGVSLDDAALVSRDISAALDERDVMGEIPYTLEVSSPGVDRPLTQPRHWRRAAGRLVKVKAAGEGSLTGRVTESDDDGVTLTLGTGGARRRFSYGELGPGTVQVEFGKIPAELEDFDNSNNDNSNNNEAPGNDGDDVNGGGSGGGNGDDVNGSGSGDNVNDDDSDNDVNDGGNDDNEGNPDEADLGADGDGH